MRIPINLTRLHRRLLGFSLFAMAVLLTGPLGAQSTDAPPEKTGLKVGAKAAPFQLKAQDGKSHSLAELTRKKPIALVFVRSVDW